MICPYCSSHGPFSRLVHDHVVCKKCGYKFSIWEDLALHYRREGKPDKGDDHDK